MKAFHFTLEAVRTVRERAEQVAMEQYAQSLVAREQAAQRVNVVQEKLKAVAREIRALLDAGCAASKAAQAHDCHRSLQQQLNECVAALGLAECQVNVALNAMLAARRQREIVDKFHENQKTRHRREQSRGEQKVLDDLAGRRPASNLSWNPDRRPVMTKLLTSSWMTLPVSAIVYLAATVAFWKTPVPPKPAETPGLHGQSGASWEFRNPEADQLLAELKEEKKAVGKKQQQLTELKQHLDDERDQITHATEAVNRMQKEFDQNVLRVQEEETANLKKLAKVYSAMTPEGATGIFAGMDDLQVAKIMVFMKETETAGVLEVLSKKGGADAKRAAALSERLRLAAFRGNPTNAAK